MQSRIRPLHHRRTSTHRCQRLCLASPRPLPLQYRLILRRLHHRRLHPLLRRHPHQQCHSRLHLLHLCRTPSLRSPRALAANWHMRDTWGCPGGRAAKPVLCAMHHGNTPIAMVYHWIMRPWCQCWKRVKRCMRLYVNMGPLRTCRPRMHRACLHQPMCPTSRSRLMLTYGKTPCIKSLMVYYRPALSHRYSNHVIDAK